MISFFLFWGGYSRVGEGFMKQCFQLFLLICLMLCCCHKTVKYFEHFANICIYIETWTLPSPNERTTDEDRTDFRIFFLSQVHYIFTICSLYIHYIMTSSSLYIHYLFTIYSLYVHYIFATFSLFIHCMWNDRWRLNWFSYFSFSLRFTIYSLYVHFIFTI